MVSQAIIVELPGEPVAKGRPRFRTGTTKSGRFYATAYTPAKTRAYSDALSWVAKEAMRGRKPMGGPLIVNTMAFMGVPPSWPTRKRDAALAGALRPLGRPDADNLQKTAWDAINKIVFLDDSQIVEAKVSKFYDERPRLHIKIEPLEVFN